MKLRTRIFALVFLLTVFAALSPAAAYAGGVALEPPESSDAQTDKKPELSKILSYALPAALMVAAGGIAGSLMKKKDKTQSAARQSAPGSYYEPDRTQPWYGGNRAGRGSAGEWYLRCRGGYQDGKEYPIKAEVRIGRSKDNDIRYPDDWPTISRHHARIRLYDDPDGSFVELTDLSSTEIYLKKGGAGESKADKIPKNTPVRLQPGDVFYLGEKENRFELIRKKEPV